MALTPVLQPVLHGHLEDALLAALGNYDIKPDIKGLLARLPRQAGSMRIDDILPICKKLQLSVIGGKQTETEIRLGGLPALMIYDTAIAVFMPSKGKSGDFRVFGEKTPSSTLLHTYAILPPDPQSKVDTSHMKSWHSLDWFWEPVRRYWKQYSEILVVSFFSNLLVIALPIFTMNVYDRVAVNFSEATLIVLTLGIVLALFFDFLFKNLRTIVLERVAGRVGAQYDLDLMERLMAIKPTAMKLSVGEKTNLFREIQGIKDFYASRLMPSLVDVPFFFLFVGVMYVISPWVALVPFLAAIAIIVVTRGLQVPVNRAAETHFKGMQNKSATLVQMLTGTDTLKMLGATGSGLFQWNVVSQHSIDTARKNNVLISITTNLCIMITYLVTVFVLVVGVHQISQGALTVGGLVACSLLSGRAIGPIINISGLIGRLKQSSDVLKAIDRIFTLPHDDIAQTRNSAKGPLKGTIEFSEVSFAYPEQPRPALQKVSLTIQPGERVALIGRTGAGKTTLARMITRFLEPVQGTLFIDGYAMDSISPEELHRSVGYVPQDGFFFSGTIRSNILMGVEDASEEALQQAVKLSGLDIILQSVGGGLDMEVGEGGKRLSGGQKQALALARAIVRNPSILVFDEPTNGIDNGLEATIKQGLESYLQGRTFVMITHRTTLLSLVDRLILLDNGRVVADGPRDEVLARLAGGNANVT